MFDKMTYPEPIDTISDFSNVSGTHLDLLPQYDALNASGTVSVSPTPDLDAEKIVKCQDFRKMTDSKVMVLMSDFSNMSGTIMQLQPEYEALIGP